MSYLIYPHLYSKATFSIQTSLAIGKFIDHTSSSSSDADVVNTAVGNERATREGPALIQPGISGFNLLPFPNAYQVFM
jgi:hypothetical protein